MWGGFHPEAPPAPRCSAAPPPHTICEAFCQLQQGVEEQMSGIAVHMASVEPEACASRVELGPIHAPAMVTWVKGPQVFMSLRQGLVCHTLWPATSIRPLAQQRLHPPLMKSEISSRNPLHTCCCRFVYVSLP